MGFLQDLLEFVLHLDRHLFDLCTQYGAWVYSILFAVVFCETGFVVTPFLPGDSLLFAVGSLAAINALDLPSSLVLLILAAVLGDTMNYWIGNYVGPKVFNKEKSRFLNREYLVRTNQFYERHGGKTIIIARFLPIIRTFAPFVAGIGHMRYRRFLMFNFVGGAAWVVLFISAGYFFGSVPFVKNNFSLVIIALILIPGIPSLVEIIRMQLRKRKAN